MDHLMDQLLVVNFRIVPVKGMSVSMVHDNKYRMKNLNVLVIEKKNAEITQ